MRTAIRLHARPLIIEHAILWRKRNHILWPWHTQFIATKEHACSTIIMRSGSKPIPHACAFIIIHSSIMMEIMHVPQAWSMHPAIQAYSKYTFWAHCSQEMRNHVLWSMKHVSWSKLDKPLGQRHVTIHLWKNLFDPILIIRPSTLAYPTGCFIQQVEKVIALATTPRYKASWGGVCPVSANISR